MKPGDLIKVWNQLITNLQYIKYDEDEETNFYYFKNLSNNIVSAKEEDVILVSPTDYKEGTFYFGKCTVMVSIDNGKWHLSISKKNASPSYKEIKAARYKYIPDAITMAQLFPSKEEFVNLHKHCHHLWQINEL